MDIGSAPVSSAWGLAILLCLGLACVIAAVQPTGLLALHSYCIGTLAVGRALCTQTAGLRRGLDPAGAREGSAL
jgi:hypothetical protein